MIIMVLLLCLYIVQALNDEMINGRDIKSKKAASLVNESKRALDNDANPDISTVSRNVEERQITDSNELYTLTAHLPKYSSLQVLVLQMLHCLKQILI